MINIIVTHQGQTLILDIKGHALFASKGEDIVCAGVSTASIMTANLFEQVTHTTSFLNEGQLTITIHDYRQEHHYIYRVFKKAIDDIISIYPSHVIWKESEGA
jgi:uncharacterized protein YsxB (DUF464 family)